MIRQLRPVVKPGEVWESRDTRDFFKGPDGFGSRQVRVVQVLSRHVVVKNTVTGKETTIQLAVFASRRMRGGFRKVADAPPKHEYRIVGPAGNVSFRLSRSMRLAGWGLQRRGPEDDAWEDVPNE